MELLERLGTDFALRAVSAFSERSFGGSSKRATEASRAIAELEGRTPGRKIDYSVEKVLFPAGIGAIVGGVGGAVYLNQKRNEMKQRDVS